MKCRPIYSFILGFIFIGCLKPTLAEEVNDTAVLVIVEEAILLEDPELQGQIADELYDSVQVDVGKLLPRRGSLRDANENNIKVIKKCAKGDIGQYLLPQEQACIPEGFTLSGLLLKAKNLITVLGVTSVVLGGLSLGKILGISGGVNSVLMAGELVLTFTFLEYLFQSLRDIQFNSRYKAFGFAHGTAIARTATQMSDRVRILGVSFETLDRWRSVPWTPVIPLFLTDRMKNKIRKNARRYWERISQVLSQSNAKVINVSRGVHIEDFEAKANRMPVSLKMIYEEVTGLPIVEHAQKIGKATIKIMNEELARIARQHEDVTFVFSAGNHGGQLTGETFPDGSGVENMLIVGSRDQHGWLSHFSGWSNTHVDVASIGEKVQFLDLQGADTVNSGTSISAPKVAAILALIRKDYPDMTESEARAFLYEHHTRNNSNLVDSIVAGRDLIEPYQGKCEVLLE